MAFVRTPVFCLKVELIEKKYQRVFCFVTKVFCFDFWSFFGHNTFERKNLKFKRYDKYNYLASGPLFKILKKETKYSFVPETFLAI